MTLSLADQVACVKREIAMRQRVYPGQVVRGTITQAWADFQLAAMRAVLTTLEDLQEAQAGQGTLFAQEDTP